MTVSCDPNLRLPLWSSPAKARAGMKEALRHADIMKMSEEEAEFLGTVPRARLVVITRGPRGGRVTSEEGRFDFPAFRVPTVDSTGAGDAFVAGMLYGILRDLPLRETIRLAAACGALVTLKRGAIPALPTRAAVRKMLSARHGSGVAR